MTVMNYEYSFLLSLFLTVIVETSVLFIAFRHFFIRDTPHLSNSLLLFAGIFASFSTLPYLWFILPLFIKPYYMYAAVGEFLVVLIESVIYYFVLRIGSRKALLLSFVCNLASFLTGLMLNLIY